MARRQSADFPFSRHNFPKTSRRFKRSVGLVELLEHRELLTTYFVNTALDNLDTQTQDGLLSLREALLASILNQPVGDAPAGVPGLDEIKFNISGPDLTIRLVEALPAITDPVLIDGTSQPGFSGAPLIELDGSETGSDDPGLHLLASGNTIRGLVINRFGREGILVGSNGNLITGNHIGTDRSGTIPLPNRLDALRVIGANNTIGGVLPGDGNLLSGNLGSGIFITGDSAFENLIQGNRIGTDVSGEGPLPNNSHGILIQDATFNRIGLGNRNVIRFNNGDGVRVLQSVPGIPADGNLIDINSISSNGGLGIDLGGDGPTPNDPGDQDDGPNGLINAPVLTSVTMDPDGKLRINGRIDVPFDPDFAEEYVVRFFQDEGDPSGFGEGLTHLSGYLIRVGMPGPTPFSFEVLPTGASPFFSALVNNQSGSTSEFSNILAIPANLSVAISPTNSYLFVGGEQVYTVVARNSGPVKASGTNLSTTLPLGFRIIDASASRGELFVSGQVLNVNLGTLQPGEQATLTIRVVAEQPGTLETLATLSSITPEGLPSDNSAFASAVVNSLVDLTLTKSPARQMALVDDIFSFVLVARNAGPSTADSVRLVDTLPAGLRLISASTSQGTVSTDHQTITAEIGSLEPGREAFLTLIVSASEIGSYVNTAEIASSGVDAKPDDNRASAEVLVDDLSLVVTNTNDDGRGSLRRALQNSNRLPTRDTVTFAIPGAGPHIITLASPLPLLNDSLVVDGASQPAGILAIDGSKSGGSHGLVLLASESEINGLSFYGFQAAGLLVRGSRNRILENGFGIELPAGELRGNLLDGLVLSDAADNLIRGNHIIGNGRHGVLIAGPGSTRNVLLGNTIGLDQAKTRPLGNGEAGVLIVNGATANTVGAGNTISANGTVGVGLYGPSSADGLRDRLSLSPNNVVVASAIGTSATNGLSLPNRLAGVLILDSQANRIGGAGSESNQICWGTGAGIWIVGGASRYNTVSNNLLGLDSTGALPNFEPGTGLLVEYGALDNTLSGNTVANPRFLGISVAHGADGTLVEGNRVLSVPSGLASTGTGILVQTGARGSILRGNVLSGLARGVVLGSGAEPSRLVGNRIGFDLAAPYGNIDVGIEVSSSGHTIGGRNAGESNTIAGNGIGILLNGPEASKNLILGNQIGGPGAWGNLGHGIFINSSAQNTIGGEAAGAGNLISGNGAGGGGTGSGIFVSGPSATGNLILGNRIGADPGNASSDGNALDGISLINAPGNTIGGATPTSANTISGNRNSGVRIAGAISTGNLLLGNRIGTDPAGAFAVPNARSGVLIEDAPANTLGGPAPGAANLISGNDGVGIELRGANATANLILGNFIGTNLTGTGSIPNATDGIYLDNAPGNLIGGRSASEGNLISGNRSVGIQIFGGKARGNVVAGNRLGTTSSGDSALPNGRNGIYINEAPANIIGSFGPGGGNLISGNLLVGVQISGPGAESNVLLGNQIGTNAAGTTPLPNGSTGVLIENAPRNTIGGPSASLGNIISGNTVAGIYLFGPLSRGTVVQGNRVGTDAQGQQAIPNGDGILIDAAPGSLIGGDQPGAGNVISGNHLGIRIARITASGNSIQGNLIGLAADGDSRLGNLYGGIFVSGAPGNLIGGPVPGQGNTISANGGQGIQIFGAGASGNLVAGNRIGTSAAGTAFRGNLGGGVFINDAPSNTIGGRTPGSGNLIAGNREFQIFVSGSQARGNVIEGNTGTLVSRPRPSRVRFVRRPST